MNSRYTAQFALICGHSDVVVLTSYRPIYGRRVNQEL